MKGVLYALLLFLLPAHLFAQDHWRYAYYQQYDHTNFRSFAAFNASVSTSQPDLPLLNAALFFLTNEQRVRNGLSPLPHHPMLEAAAFHHSLHMANSNFFSHTNTVTSSRASTSDRGKLAGVINPYFAENIAMNSATSDTYLGLATKLMTQWMNSSGHKANILSVSGKQMGCGAYFSGTMVYGTQVFQWYEMVQEMPDGGVDKLPAEGRGVAVATNSNTYGNTANTNRPTSNPTTAPNTTSTTTRTTTTTTTKPNDSNTVVPEKKKSQRYHRLQIGVGVQGNYLHGEREGDVSGSQLIGAQVGGWLGAKLGTRKKSPVIAAFATGGALGTGAAESYFVDFGDTPVGFFEFEAGTVLEDALRLSVGVGSIAGANSPVDAASGYYVGTLGYGIGKNVMRFNLSVAIMTGDATSNKVLLRPAAGMSFRLNFLKI